MLKKIMASILAIAIMLTASPMMEVKAEANLEDFKDFQDLGDTPYSEAIAFGVYKEILKGDDNNNLNMKKDITKAEMATMMVRIFGISDKIDDVDDIDLPNLSKGKWYYNNVAKAVQMEMIKDNINDAGANAPLTRQETFVILSRAFKVHELNSTQAPTGFTDLGNIADWAEKEIYAMVNSGYINGRPDGTIDPKTSIKRQEVIQTIFNMLGDIVNTSEEITTLNIVDSLVINKSDVTIRDSVIRGDLIITEGAGDGEVVLDNVRVDGNILVRAGLLKLEGNTSTSKLLVYSDLDPSIGSQVVIGEILNKRE